MASLFPSTNRCPALVLLLTDLHSMDLTIVALMIPREDLPGPTNAHGRLARGGGGRRRRRQEQHSQLSVVDSRVVVVVVVFTLIRPFYPA